MGHRDERGGHACRPPQRAGTGTPEPLNRVEVCDIHGRGSHTIGVSLESAVKALRLQFGTQGRG